jgi:hypothetical protein
MRFPILDTEFTAQVDDKIRLNAGKSFYTPEETEFDEIEIEPYASAGFIDVTAAKYLDYVYSSAGTKVVTVRVTNTEGTTSKSFDVVILTAVSDALFSNDDELKAHETNIIEFLPDGKSSWKFQHRRVQAMIMDEIARRGFRDVEGEKYTKADVVDVLEVREWATFKCLEVIMNGLSNAVDDVFSVKADKYMKLADAASKRAYLALDHSGDGTLSDAEKLLPFDKIKLERR